MFIQVSSRSLIVVASLGLLGACTDSHDTAGAKSVRPSSTRGDSATTSKPASSGGVIIPAGALPRASGETLEMPGGGVIKLRVVAGERFLPIEGTFSDDSYQSIVARSASAGLSGDERRKLLESELTTALQALGQSVRLIQLQTHPEIGYFKALVPVDSFSSMALAPGMTRTLLVNPVVTTRFDARVARKLSTDVAAGLTAFDDAASDLNAFSGLARVGVPEFLDKVQSELGVTPDGSRVKVGVTDTGITLNHPTFAGADGASRVVYLKDFTDEGRIFFHPDAQFDIRIPNEIPEGTDAKELLLLSAQFLVAPPGAGEAPVADKFSTVADQPILVDSKLRSILTTPGSGARLGVLSEGAYNSAMEPIDLNRNGKIDDNLWVIYVPGKEEDADTLYFDVTGRADFRTATPLTRFNVARATQQSFQEKFGVDIKRATIQDSAGEDVDVVTAAVVGFDPGNHGSHVSGIIAGRKTIANDANDTLARGVAPAASLMVDRVCANSGGCDEVEAMIDLAQNGAEVVNVSIGGLSPFNDGYGVAETVVNRLTALYNTLFFISAGNEGPGHNTVGSPAVARFAISVGATASRTLLERQYQWPASGKISAPNPGDDDFVLFFSGRGPTAAGGFKPDITAPGTELSSVQLNAAPGGREGLDVYWGTSMAAPTATGSAALLIDAIKLYNAHNPAAPLSLDALTLRRVITSSARPFDVQTYNPRTQESTSGQYTWIDQGNGMFDLSRAWDALKAERDSRVASAVTRDVEGTARPVTLDYEVRVLRTNPNGLPYDGSLLAPTTGDGLEARFGRGIWLGPDAKLRVVPVQIARRLPPNLSDAPDVAELTRQLNTTADQFKLETIIHGSKLPWIRAGVLSGLDGPTATAPQLTVVGAGAIDQPIDPETETGNSVSPRDSTLYVYIDHTLFDALPPGDHGALIKAYRTVNGATEKTPSFVVPVYATIPHKTLAGKAGYSITGNVSSFGVSKNYVNVPEGTKLVKVTLAVAPPTVHGTDVTGCAGVELEALEGVNTALPPEFVLPADSRALGCDATGAPNKPELQRVTYARQDPNPGVWDLDIFGLYQYSNSQYTLDVEYAKLTATPESIDGDLSALSGSLDVSVEESSFPLELAAELSSYQLLAHIQQVSATVAQDEDLQVPNADGVVARTYDADVVEVDIVTGGSTGNDIDLVVKECDDQALTTCTIADQSGSPTDQESVAFAPKPGKFYVAVVSGYDIATGDGTFALLEALLVEKADAGVITAASSPSTHFDYSLDPTTSVLLSSPRFTSGKYGVLGQIDLADPQGTVILSIPVNIHQ